jgi:hypothetical protein
MKGSLFFVGIILCLYSCSLEDEGGDYRDSFGVVKLSGDNKQYIASDENEVLIPSQNVSSFVETGDRVWISYNIEKENPNRDTLTILPNRITRIMPLELQNEAKLNEDGIDLWTVWVAQDFLTFDFRIRARDQETMKEHKYELASLRKESTDTLFINFRHDADGDNYGVLCRTAVALKLNNLKIANDSVVIVIDYKNLNGIKQTEYRTYKKVKN